MSIRERSLFMGGRGPVENGGDKDLSAHDLRGPIFSARSLRGAEFQCILEQSM